MKVVRNEARYMCGIILVLLLGCGIQTVSADDYQLVDSWGSYGRAGHLFNPVQIAVDGNGFTYVLDQDETTGLRHMYLYKYDPSGAYIETLAEAYRIASDPAGNIYFAGENSVKKFDPDGDLLKTWNVRAGLFAVDSSGNIYVVDSYNGRIQKYDPESSLVTQWGSLGWSGANGEFSDPRGIAIDSADNVYVTDSGNCRIQKFDSNGTFLTSWSNYGDGIAIDDSDAVYVAGTYADHGIIKYDVNGTVLAKWGPTGSGDGEFNTPAAIAVDRTGTIYVADSYNGRVQKVTPDGSFAGKWETYGRGGMFVGPSGIALDHSGHVYVMDGGNSRLEKFTTTGTFLSAWGSYGSANGQFAHYFYDNEPSGAAVDSAGNVYVADTGNNRIQKFDPDGTFLAAWEAYGSGDGQFSYPKGIAIDAADNVYVTDETWYPATPRVQVFSTNGTFLRKCELAQNAAGIAIDSAGTLYVSITDSHRVQHLNATGGILAEWGGPGSLPGQFDRPNGIAVDGKGDVLIADSGNSRIQKFTPNGTFISAFGTNGSGEGQLYHPEYLAADARGNVYVADYGNGRVQKYADPAATVPVIAVAGGGEPPTDTNGDGIYDDVNGNGRLDFADVVLFFNQMTWIAGNEPVTAFDCNRNGRIDFSDVVWLFNNL
ncbi:MAG: dockerin type I domain-containing protein [Methanospirillum sp.]